MDVTPSLPAAKPGRAWTSSGLAVASSSNGPAERPIRRSSISTSSSPAQCRSSMTMTVGRRAASAEAKRGHARVSSSATERGWSWSSGLSGNAIPAVVASANTVCSSSSSGSSSSASATRAPARSFLAASSAGSSSAIPKASRRISASAQYVIPRPVARQRPMSATGSPCSRALARNSRVRRLLPIPAGP